MQSLTFLPMPLANQSSVYKPERNAMKWTWATDNNPWKLLAINNEAFRSSSETSVTHV